MGISYWELGIGLNRKKQDTKNKEAQWREKNKNIVCIVEYAIYKKKES